jgi:hypothetical protein
MDARRSFNELQELTINKYVGRWTSGLDAKLKYVTIADEKEGNRMIYDVFMHRT